MTMPAVVRIFFAIDLPVSHKKALGSYLGQLKKTSKTSAIRWTRPENLHITLHFLAEVKREDLPILIAKVREELKEAHLQVAPSIGALQLFPNPYRPRVIVFDILPQEALQQLVIHIGRGISACHYVVETRPFRAHLTIGRIKQPHGLNLQFLSECAAPVLEAIPLKEVVLFRSEPQSDGSRYTPLETISLSPSCVAP